MQQEHESQTIYFKDLLFRALYRWKIALVVAVVLALALGGFGILKSGDPVNLNTATLTPEMEQKIELLQFNLEVSQLNITRQKEYLEGSVLMQINPREVYTAGFHLVAYPQSMLTSSAEASAIDNTSAILRAYQSAMSSEETMGAIAQKLNMKSTYLTELIVYDTTVVGSLGFSVRARSAQEAKTIADALQKALVTKTESVTELVEAHTIKIVPFESGPKIDSALYDTQNSAYQRLTTLTNNVTSMESELDRLLPTKISTGKFSPMVLAVIGGILGIGLTACCAWVAHIGGDKIYSAKALFGITGIRVLACIPGEKKYDIITKWLRKLEGRSAAACYDAVACDIRNRCKDGSRLLIAGVYEKSALDGLTKALKDAGICCTVCGDMEDPALFDALAQCDSVLLAETCMQSRYDSVQKMIQTVNDYDKALLGCLLIDG